MVPSVRSTCLSFRRSVQRLHCSQSAFHHCKNELGGRSGDFCCKTNGHVFCARTPLHGPLQTWSTFRNPEDQRDPMRANGSRIVAGFRNLDAHASAHHERWFQPLRADRDLACFSSKGSTSSAVADSESQLNSSKPPTNRNWSTQTEDEKHWTFEAPLSSALKRVKLLSLVSSGTTLASAPLLVTAGPAEMSWYAKASLAASLSGFGLFTTGLLHWFTYPYVHRLIHHVRTDTCTATQLNVFGRPKSTSFKVSDATVPQTVRPMVSFVVANRYYFIDSASFNNQELYSRLVPAEEAPGDVDKDCR